MVKKKKKQKITFKSIIRLSIFVVILTFLINILSQQQKPFTKKVDPTSFVGENSGGQILGTIYSKLPTDSRYQLEHIDQTLLGKIYQDSKNYVVTHLNGFPQKQIKEFKKQLIKNISDDLIENIDKK
jgi:hypothetical protein